MKNEIEKAIVKLAVAITAVSTPEACMKSSQAVLNLTNALAVLDRIEGE
jgi:hypothetical protein|tara:strand:+ start:450 stop:596 length:147 start_codon:yes stop_codon:yes gene_type:complete